MNKPVKIIAITAGVIALTAAAAALIVIGPRNVWGMLRYDQRQSGTLKVGDAAPDVLLTALDGTTRVPLRSRIGARPLVLIFGSFT